jgi:hypothetical protein
MQPFWLKVTIFPLGLFGEGNSIKITVKMVHNLQSCFFFIIMSYVITVYLSMRSAVGVSASVGKGSNKIQDSQVLKNTI